SLSLAAADEGIERPALPGRKPARIDAATDAVALVADGADLLERPLDLHRLAVVQVEIARIADIGGMEDLLERRPRPPRRRAMILRQPAMRIVGDAETVHPASRHQRLEAELAGHRVDRLRLLD